MSRENSPSSNRRKVYFAEYWQDVSVVSSEEVVLQQQSEDVQTANKKKRKSRGNRQLQRYRAKLRNQGLDNETIASMINPEYDSTKPQRVSAINAATSTTTEVTTILPKRKRGTTAKTGGVPTSVSEVSLAQPSTKRTRSALTTTDLQVNTITPPKKKSNYLHLTDTAFKKLLSATLKGIDEDNLMVLVDTPEKVQYIRIYTQLINNLFYLKLKDAFWKSYEEVVLSSSEIDFNSHLMSKSGRKEHHLHRFQFVKRENIHKLELSGDH